MPAQQIVWDVPETLYRELLWAQHELKYPSLADLLVQAVQRRLAEIKRETWHRELREAQEQIRAGGGFGLGETKDEVISNLREIRRQIVDEDYADLY